MLAFPLWQVLGLAHCPVAFSGRYTDCFCLYSCLTPTAVPQGHHVQGSGLLVHSPPNALCSTTMAGGHSHPPHTLGGKKVRVLSECLPLLLTRPSSHGGSQCPCPLVSHFQVSLDLQELKRNVLFFQQYLLPGVKNHGMLTRQSLCLCFTYSRQDDVFQVVDYFHIEHNNFIDFSLPCLPKNRVRIKVSSNDSVSHTRNDKIHHTYHSLRASQVS